MDFREYESEDTKMTFLRPITNGFREAGNRNCYGVDNFRG